jgi:ankyrin repeat protein
MHAIEQGHVVTARALIDAKAKASPQTRDAELTALHFAVEHNVEHTAAELCRALLLANERTPKELMLEHQTVCGDTPLQLAAQLGRSHIAMLLLSAKADALASSGDGNAIEQALEHKHADTAHAIRSWPKDSAAARAFERGMRHARYRTCSKQQQQQQQQPWCWTSSMIFDINLIDEITSYVTLTMHTK